MNRVKVQVHVICRLITTFLSIQVHTQTLSKHGSKHLWRIQYPLQSDSLDHFDPSGNYICIIQQNWDISQSVDGVLKWGSFWVTNRLNGDIMTLN